MTSTSQIRKFNLNVFLDELYAFKNLLGAREEEILLLRRELLHARKLSETLEVSNSLLLGEVSGLNEAVPSIWNAFSDWRADGEDRKKSDEEKKKLRLQLEVAEKRLREAAREAERAADLEEALRRGSRQLEESDRSLADREREILTLQEKVTGLVAEKDEALLRMRLQNEAEVERLKNQVSKMKKAPSSATARSDDVFRQKYLRLEREHALLKAEADRLRRRGGEEEEDRPLARLLEEEGQPRVRPPASRPAPAPKRRLFDPRASYFDR